MIRREVLIRPGQTWDPEVIAETKRRLADPLFTTFVVLTAVRSKTPGKVSLLVVTRDIWSLRMNSAFEVQDGSLTQLSISASENNLFGLRKHVALVFNLDQGQFSLGPQYVDKNIAGTRLRLSTNVGILFSRSGRNFEGSRSTTIFSYPLWSLSRKWGAGLTASHFDSTVRQFLGARLRTYDNPDTLETESIPRVYEHQTLNLESSVVRSLGTNVKHSVTGGHALSIRRPSVFDDFGEGVASPTRFRVAVARAAFERDVLPRSERASAMFLRYSLFTPRYIVYRNLSTYDLPEDARLGPDFGLTVSTALKLLGSEQNFVALSSSAGWTHDIAKDGFFRASVSANGRIRGKDFSMAASERRHELQLRECSERSVYSEESRMRSSSTIPTTTS